MKELKFSLPESFYTDREDFFISKKSRTPVPDISKFKNIKDKVLGADYVLSLVFIGDSFSRKLNKKYRGKDKPANILSFSISKKEGEIFINLRKTKEEKMKFNLSYGKFVGKLFIHGLLHLKGMAHSSTMDKEENVLFKKFFV